VNSRKRIIIISGFTAAGKTTHARLLAKYLGWSYLGSSEVRRKLPATPAHDREWHPAIDAARAKSPAFDRALDDEISCTVKNSKVPLVVDAWLQPWLYGEDNALRVWLNSDTASRTMKAAVSYLRLGMQPPKDIAAEVRVKDQFSIQTFDRIYGIEFAYSTKLFDVLCDNSGYITEATIPASDHGISEYQPIFQKLVAGQL
jgi:cytidylate kinase